MKAFHNTRRPHIKVGKYEKEEEEGGLRLKVSVRVMVMVDVRICTLLGLR